MRIGEHLTASYPLRIRRGVVAYFIAGHTRAQHRNERTALRFLFINCRLRVEMAIFQKKMFCKNCGAEMADNAKICMKCGVMAGDGDKFCSNCGAEPDPKAVICVKCGMALNPAFNKNYFTPAKVENLMQAVKVCFQKYATFEGRATRAEFWFWQLFHLLCFIGLLLLMFISNFLYNIGNTSVTPDAPQLIEPFWGLPFIYGFYLIFLLGTIMPSLAVVVRRLHDIGKSGWFYFIGAIPIIGGIILLIWMCKDSEPRRNQYGLSLKENVLHKL